MIPLSHIFTFILLLQLTSATDDLFDKWCDEYGKTYASEVEKQDRYKIFQDNYAYVSQHNTFSNSTYTLSLNAFADLTHHEFKSKYLGLSLSANDLIRLNSAGDSPSSSSVSISVPTSLDWRQKGAVTNVKDQGSCGACWAFSATGAIEGINKIVSGSLVSLSEQELVDCDRSSLNSGCGGGLMDYAYEFVVKNHGIDTEEDYPFQGRESTCNRNKLKRRLVTIDGYKDVAPNAENELQLAVASQPVSVGICGSERSFQLYSGGIFTGPCSTSLDHAVLIVGYDSKDGVDYWIVKNSWGTSWGMKGYIHMVRNHDGNSGAGVCGINMMASYPVKTSPNPPPPSPPSPVKCSLFSSCNGGETCCCTKHFLGFCLSWSCCGLDSAVCCKDHQHCCPHDYPICDTKKNLCLKKSGNYTLAKQLEDGGGLSRSVNAWNFLFPAV